MGNFAENLNLGNRFRPPWYLATPKIVYIIIYTPWPNKNASILFGIIFQNPGGGFLVQKSMRGRAAEMGRKISLLV